MDSVITKMLRYQAIHDIKGKCVDNTKYLMDSINASAGRKVAKVKAVLACWNDEHDTMICVHLVVMVNDVLYDPSYETSRHSPVYIDKIKDIDFTSHSISLRDILSNFLQFMSIAKGINEGRMILSDTKYYNNQADFMESMVRDKPKE